MPRTVRRQWGIGDYSIDGNEAHAVLQSPNHRRGRKTGVIYGHGHSTLPHAALVLLYNQLFLGDVAFPLAEMGRQVFMGDFEDNAWGATAAGAMATMDEAEVKSQELGASDESILLMGGSMGFITVCNWARMHLERVDAIAGFIPAVDHNDIRARNYGGYAAEIVSKYGGQAAYDAARPTHNPIEYAAELAAADIGRALWYSTNDGATLPASVEAFAEEGDFDLHPLGDVGHSTIGMDFKELIDFMEEYATR